jgi:hypothetical protein
MALVRVCLQSEFKKAHQKKKSYKKKNSNLQGCMHGRLSMLLSILLALESDLTDRAPERERRQICIFMCLCSYCDNECKTTRWLEKVRHDIKRSVQFLTALCLGKLPRSSDDKLSRLPGVPVLQIPVMPPCERSFFFVCLFVCLFWLCSALPVSV